jgi:hypothetical protein
MAASFPNTRAAKKKTHQMTIPIEGNRDANSRVALKELFNISFGFKQIAPSSRGLLSD